jgi:hypothetical protein
MSNPSVLFPLHDLTVFGLGAAFVLGAGLLVWLSGSNEDESADDHSF